MMDNIVKRVHTENGKLVLSIILGFGLATIFRKACYGVECYIYKPPPSEEIKDQIYKFDNKCYKFRDSNIGCGKKRIQVIA